MMKRLLAACVLSVTCTAAIADSYTNSSVSSAQTYYLTLLGPTAASHASTQMDRLGQHTQDDSLAYIATDGAISGPALELAYNEARSQNPRISRLDVAMSMVTH